jgi:hypothetical protein
VPSTNTWLVMAVISNCNVGSRGLPVLAARGPVAQAHQCTKTKTLTAPPSVGLDKDTSELATQARIGFYGVNDLVVARQQL